MTPAVTRLTKESANFRGFRSLFRLKNVIVLLPPDSNAKKLKEKWQKETYSFKVFYNEIEACQLQQEKRALRGQKRKLKASLADEQAKRLKVEE